MTRRYIRWLIANIEITEVTQDRPHGLDLMEGQAGAGPARAFWNHHA